MIRKIYGNNYTSGLRMRKLKENMIGYTMIIPAMFFFFLFLVYPVFKSIQISLYDYSGIGELTDFIGFKNYLTSLADKEFFTSIYNTLVLVVFDVVISTVIGFCLAYMLFKRIGAWKFFSVVLYIPAIVPITVAGLIWRQIYEPNQGLLNSVLKNIGLDALANGWISGMNTAMPSVIIAWVWRVIPFLMLILYSGMLRIPEELFESAKIDGAREINVLKSIVIPYIMPIISVLVIYVIAWDFRAFDMIWVLTEGGPGNVTEIGPVYVYKVAAKFMDYGYANAVGVEIFFVVGLIVYGIISLMKKVGISDDGV